MQENAQSVSLGKIMESVGPLGLVLSLLMPLMFVAGILVIALAKDTKPIKLFMLASFLPVLLGFAAKSTGAERREEIAARHGSLTVESLEQLPVTMGVVAFVPSLALGFLGLILKSGKRRRVKKPTGDPLDG